MGYRFAFVILHYNSIESTQKCVESIRNLDRSQEAGVVIVDNASPNATGAVLERLYAQWENIKVILHPENVGFAKGNNIGYLYAKQIMEAEYIICANNDVYFIQKDFLIQLESLCVCNQASVLGPDIRTYHEAHQNPLREGKLSFAQFWKKHLIKCGWLVYWHVCRTFSFLTIGLKLREKATRRHVARKRYHLRQTDIVLQGACILFLKDYIQKEDEAFVPDTFMYMEEDILAYKCQMRGYRMLYCPEIYVFHAESLSTTDSFSHNIDKELFYYRECLKSDKILYRYMRTARRAKYE